MARFERLTAYIPVIAEIKNPYDIITKVNEDVHAFVDDNKDLELYNYSDILRKHKIEYNDEAVMAVDYQSMDGQVVAALIVTVVRAERIYEGTINQFIQNGYILKWLKRLKQIDEE